MINAFCIVYLLSVQVSSNSDVQLDMTNGSFQRFDSVDRDYRPLQETPIGGGGGGRYNLWGAPVSPADPVIPPQPLRPAPVPSLPPSRFTRPPVDPPTPTVGAQPFMSRPVAAAPHPHHSYPFIPPPPPRTPKFAPVLPPPSFSEAHAGHSEDEGEWRKFDCNNFLRKKLALLSFSCFFDFL